MKNKLNHGEMVKLTERVTRRMSRTLAVLGASALAVMMVGSVLAVLSDNVTIAGGYIASDDWDGNVGPPPGATFDLRIKQGPCVAGEDGFDQSLFSDDSVMNFAAIDDLDLASIADQLGVSERAWTDLPPMCLFNASPYNGTIDMTILAASSLEAGPCGMAETDAEIASGNPDPCGVDGEMTDIARLFMSCGGYSPDASFGTDVGVTFDTNSTLLAGEFCETKLAVFTRHFNNTTTEVDPNLLAALSDTLSFDIAIDLRAT